MLLGASLEKHVTNTRAHVDLSLQGWHKTALVIVSSNILFPDYEKEKIDIYGYKSYLEAMPMPTRSKGIPFSSYDKVSREMYGDQISAEPLPMTMRSRTIANSTFVNVTKSTTNTHDQPSKFSSWWPTIIYHLMHLKCHSCYSIAVNQPIYGLLSSNSCKLYHPFIYFMELARVKCTYTMDNEHIFVMNLE